MTHESSARETSGNVRPMSGKAMNMMLVSSEAANTATLVVARISQARRASQPAGVSAAATV
jgi:hypothetical protein